MKEVVDGQVVVIRGGELTIKALEDGAEKKDTRDLLYGVSVQVSPKGAKRDAKIIGEMVKPIPNNMYSDTNARYIMDKGGKIYYNPLKGNLYHGLVSNITAEDLFKVFSSM
jgi:hypothetical protein